MNWRPIFHHYEASFNKQLLTVPSSENEAQNHSKVHHKLPSQAIGSILRKDGSFVLGVFTILAHKKLSARYQVVSTSRSLDKIYHRLKIVICGCKRSQIDVRLALKHQQATLASVAHLVGFHPLPHYHQSARKRLNGWKNWEEPCFIWRASWPVAISEHIVMTYTH